MYLTGDWHGYVRRADGRRWSCQDRQGRARASYIEASAIRGLQPQECLFQIVKRFNERVTG